MKVAMTMPDPGHNPVQAAGGHRIHRHQHGPCSGKFGALLKDKLGLSPNNLITRLWRTGGLHTVIFPQLRDKRQHLTEGAFFRCGETAQCKLQTEVSLWLRLFQPHGQNFYLNLQDGPLRAMRVPLRNV